MRILFDTCIIIDFFLNREGFADDAETIITAVGREEIDGLLSVKSLMDIHYVLKKHLHNEKNTRQIIRILIDSFSLADSTAAETIQALDSPMNDFEDALMTETAAQLDVDYIVTRNLKDYRNSRIPVVTPKQLISYIGS